MIKNILIRGAAQHNLKGIDVEIPRNKFVVITGLSGSGKSSLAFDTLYAEGQRRYVESLSSYARQFLDKMQKPKVDHIEGLSPAIAIEQRSSGTNPRSTVATTTEIYDYLRLLYAHTGTPHCPKCGKILKSQSAEAICDTILGYPEKLKMMLLAPVVTGKKGEHLSVIEKIKQDGFVRVAIDGEIYSLDDKLPKLERQKKHTIEIVIDRLITGKVDRTRLTDSVELALQHGNGIISVMLQNKESASGWDKEQLSEHLACLDCQISFGKMVPRNFSFNSPYGACKMCHGIGSLLKVDPAKAVNYDLSINKGAIPNWRRGPRHLIRYYNHLLNCLADYFDMPDMLKTKFGELPKNVQDVLLYGSGDEAINFSYRRRNKLYKMIKPFEGILPSMERRYLETDSNTVRERIRKDMNQVECPACKGARLSPESLAVTVGGLNIHQFNSLSITDALAFINNLKLNKEQQQIAEEILREIGSRLQFLLDVGLSYLSLNRMSNTLSGGEAQRIKLATQLGCGLVGVLYILDEPSIGLHQRDNERLLNTLIKLRDLGNTVIVVEHDLDTIKAADYILDLGPGAGKHGGELIFSGRPESLYKSKTSLTGQFLNGTQKIEIPKKRNKGNGDVLKIMGASFHNLKNINATIPLGTLTCVTGVSGSGKSSLINGILCRAVNKHLKINDNPPGAHKAIKGLEHINKLINIDQSPIGRTPRSNPVTYTNAFSGIRDLFAKLPESKARGYKPGRFSFNVKGGRCEECKGDGIKKIEMNFLPDVYVTCSKCNGKRFNQETLGIYYKNKNIADILDMTVNEACEFFEPIPAIYRRLKTLEEVGLGYLHLGQPATTLSGGEAQRVKLATELSKIPRGHTLYILDEPTTGLHIADIQKLLEVLIRLREKGNTVVIIEHNLDVIKVADHIIDIGPEGGDDGGEIIASGTPEKVAKCKKSYTGQFLKDLL